MAKLKITEVNSKSTKRELMLMSAVRTAVHSINNDSWSKPHLSSLYTSIRNYFLEMDHAKKENVSRFSEFFELHYEGHEDPYTLCVYHLDIKGDRDRLLVKVIMEKEAQGE